MLSKCRVYLLIIVMLGLFIFYSPIIDKFISKLPYNPLTTRFYGEVSMWCTIVYFTVPCITVAIIILSLLGLLFSKKTTSPYKIRRGAIIILLSLAIGPGLVVNLLFKDGWGRPRPYQVIRDHQNFQAVWQPNFHAPMNNSFPGGHASIGFFLGVPFLAFGYRRKGLIVSAAAGSIVSVVRILQGGHYLSDVFFSAVFVWLTAEAVIYVFDYNNKRYTLT